MDGHRCACGYEAGDELELTDHFLEVFAPQDAIATDGTVHEEGRVKLTCWCGFTAITPAGLDDHFIAVFAPGDKSGLDGVPHMAAASGR